MALDQNSLQAATEAYTVAREAGTPIIDTFPAIIAAYLQHAGEGEAEPVAWMYTSKYDGRVEFFPNNALWKEHGYAERHPDAVPLFAAPRPHQAPGEHECPICAVEFKPDDLCLTDIEMGTCHAACLAGSPMVSIDTGEPLPEDAPPPEPYRYGDHVADGGKAPEGMVLVPREPTDAMRQAFEDQYVLEFAHTPTSPWDRADRLYEAMIAASPSDQGGE